MAVELTIEERAQALADKARDWLAATGQTIEDPDDDPLPPDDGEPLDAAWRFTR